MIPLSTVVRAIITENPLLEFGICHRLFNLTQLSEYLRPMVEVRAKKKVSRTALLMAISRMQKTLKKISPAREKYAIKHLVVHTNLATLTYPKTAETHRAIQRFYADAEKKNAYMSISEGTREITLILDMNLRERLRTSIPVKPVYQHDNLSALCINFDESYVQEPGFVYVLLQHLMLQNVNFIEMNSTFTELSLFIEEHQIQMAFDTLYRLFCKRRT